MLFWDESDSSPRVFAAIAAWFFILQSLGTAVASADPSPKPSNVSCAGDGCKVVAPSPGVSGTPKAFKLNSYMDNGNTSSWNSWKQFFGAIDPTVTENSGTTPLSAPSPHSSYSNYYIQSTCYNITDATPSAKGGGLFVPVNSPNEFGAFLNSVSKSGKAIATPCPTPQAGACGPAGGGNYPSVSSIPASDYCQSGDTMVNPGPSGSQQYGWTCNGPDGGSGAQCSATIHSCGVDNGQNYTSAPSGSGLCASTATAQSVSPSGSGSAQLWAWTCTDNGSGVVSSCSADVNGSCGSASGTDVATQPSGSALCKTGSASGLASANGQWTWNCTDSGTTSSCSAKIEGSGTCGSANGQTLASAPSGASLCASGDSASSVSGSGPWTWSCQGANNGSVVACSASMAAPAAASGCPALPTQSVPASPLGTHKALASGASITCNSPQPYCPSGWVQLGNARSGFGECYEPEGISLLNSAYPGVNPNFACGTGPDVDKYPTGTTTHTAIYHCADGKTETVVYTTQVKPGYNTIYELSSDTIK